MFSLSLGEMLWSRRTIFLLLVTGAPVFLALVARIVQGSGVVPLRVNGVPVDGASIFGMMIWVFFLRFIVPVLGVFYGTALIADEVEDRTITYLFTRPIRRGAVLVGKYLAYLVCTTLVVLPSVVLVYFLLVPFGQVAQDASCRSPPTWGCWPWAWPPTARSSRWSAPRSSGRSCRGCVFVFGWEQVALLVPGYFRRFTVAHYVQSLVPHAMPSDGVASLLQSVLSDKPPALVCLLALAAIIAATLWLAARTVESREYVLDQ